MLFQKSRKTSKEIIIYFTFRAIFSDESGLTCAMQLDDLPVHFSDLFIPLEVPAQFKVNACNVYILFSIYLYALYLPNA